jgi:hypothetical protein
MAAKREEMIKVQQSYDGAIKEVESITKEENEGLNQNLKSIETWYEKEQRLLEVEFKQKMAELLVRKEDKIRS